MFRFLFFLFGIVSGFIAAVLVLPLPGKTFFNRMSKLPKNIRDVIDDTLDIIGAGLKLFHIVSDEVSHRVVRGTKRAIKKSQELRDKLIADELIEEEIGKEHSSAKEDSDLNG